MWRVCFIYITLEIGMMHDNNTFNYRSLEERAERLWKTKGKSMDEIDPSLFAKKKGGIFKDIEKQKQIALMEVQIYKYIDILDEQV